MRPTFKITANGNDITSDVSARLVDLTYEDTTDESSDSLQIKLEDTTNTLAAPKQGAILELSLGYAGDMQRIGAFVVDDVEIDGPPNVVSIQASATPFLSSGQSSPMQGRKSRSFDGKTLGEIIQTVAGDSGLSATVDSTLANIAIPHVDQLNESDLNLLLRLARRYGAILKPADGRVVVAKEQGGTTVSGQSVSVTFTAEMLSAWKVRRGGKAKAYSKVRAEVHDFETGETTDVEIETPTGGNSSSDDAYFNEVYQYATQADAQAAVSSKAQRIARSEATLDVTMPGTLSVIAGAKVTLSGVHATADGAYVAKVVRHTLSKSGWITGVSGESSAD